MSEQRSAPIWRSALLASTAIAFAAGTGATAVAKEGARVIHSAKDQVKLRVSGQINRAVIFADDGFETQTRHVDNDYSSSRFRWQADAKVNNDIKIGGIIEIQASRTRTSATAVAATRTPSQVRRLTPTRDFPLVRSSSGFTTISSAAFTWARAIQARTARITPPLTLVALPC